MKPIQKNYNFKYFEPLIVIAFWVLLFASPLLFGRFEEVIDWEHIYTVWIDYLPLLVFFLVHRFLLLPLLFFKGKRILYFIITFSLIVVATLFIYFADGKFDRAPIKKQSTERFENRPPPEFGKPFNEGRPPRNRQIEEIPRRPIQGKLKNPKPFPRFANFLILSILIVGFDAGLQIAMRWAKLEQEKVTIEKESVANQLAFLRNQISPHFFMNTLNNIHALVDIDAEESKKSIIKLSNLMRHLLYDSEENKIPIKKEIEFIKSYIELMKLRFSDKVKINVEIPSEVPDKTIPPLLFTSLLENAFKHGISYNKDSFINILMNFNEDELQFSIENSNHPKKDKEASGIGIENTKKRLALLYKDSFEFDILKNKENYRVNLNIPL